MSIEHREQKDVVRESVPKNEWREETEKYSAVILQFLLNRREEIRKANESGQRAKEYDNLVELHFDGVLNDWAKIPDQVKVFYDQKEEMARIKALYFQKGENAEVFFSGRALNGLLELLKPIETGI